MYCTIHEMQKKNKKKQINLKITITMSGPKVHTSSFSLTNSHMALFFSFVFSVTLWQVRLKHKHHNKYVAAVSS